MKHFMPCLYSVKNLLFRPLGNLLSEQSQCLVNILFKCKAGEGILPYCLLPANLNKRQPDLYRLAQIIPCLFGVAIIVAFHRRGIKDVTLG